MSANYGKANGSYKHGLRESTEYNSWTAMIQRCQNPNNPAFKNYGARGISVCSRWSHSFENFIADMGRKPQPSFSIQLINNAGNYEPGNCKWAKETNACTHGMTGSPEYSTWAGMLKRCRNPKEPSYRIYGARGIDVCERWVTFANFFADMGLKPTRLHSIDRIDNNKGYEPGNCRWATRVEQNNNTRQNHRLTINGETRTFVQWCEITGIPQAIIYRRKKRGLPFELAFTVGPDAEVHLINGNPVVCENKAYAGLLSRRALVLNAGGNPNTDKWCTGCKTTHPIKDFPSSRDRVDGLNPLCRRATSIADKRIKRNAALLAFEARP